MSIRYETEQRDGYLLIRAEGTTSDPDDMIAYVDALMENPVTKDGAHFLLDHRELHFDRGRIGTYDVALRCLDRFDRTRCIKVALVTPAERVEFARTYETLGLTECVEIKVFQRIELAAAWLTI